MSDRHKPQHDIDAFFALGRRIVRSRLLANKINRFANTSVAKLNLWDNDGVEFVGYPRGAGRVPLERFTQGANGLSILMNRFFPPFLDRPELARAGLVVGLLAIMIFRIVNLFFAAPGRDVVGIESEHLLVFFVREIVATGVVITVCVAEQFFHLFNFRDEFRAHRSVEMTWLLHLREQLRGGMAVGIVALVQDFSQDRFRFHELALCDFLFGQFHAARTKAVQRFVMQFAGGNRVRQKTDSRPEFLVRDGEVFFLHGAPAARNRFFAPGHRGLASFYFPLRDLIYALRSAGRGKRQLQNGDQARKQ